MRTKAKGKSTGNVALGDFWDGRDENNLAEFPLALLSDHVPAGQKTIEFQDTLTDWKTGQLITRRVCVTGSDKFGLPTAKDEDVLLALVQLTKLANNFSDAEVSFSKHQVIELLGWQNRGWAYDRVEESLHRWKGVSIHYWNAWRDNKQGVWTDTEAIGVIDYFRITDGRRHRPGADRHTRSRFIWNRILFESFQAGYLKPLDFGVYRNLQRSAAKRAYRFLGKRFWHQPDWEFDLQVFACEKLGFSRSYDTGQLKERLRPALGELETVGFIEPVEYRKGKPKQWKIAISKKKMKQEEVAIEDKPQSPPSDLAAALVLRGIGAGTANELVNSRSVESIAERLAFFDWLRARSDKRVSGNPPGFLVAAIRNGYPLPKDYLKSRKVHARSSSEAHGAPGQRRKAHRTASGAEMTQASGEQRLIDDYLASLGAIALAELETTALKQADAILADGYRRSQETGGAVFAGYRKMLLDGAARHALKHAPSPAKKAG